MFYDVTGSKIREGSIVEFYGEHYTIVKINGDHIGIDGTTTLKFDRKPCVDEVPCEESVKLITY
jgi:hypothetical protein